MNFDEFTFSGILSDLIDENSFACRAALSLSGVRYTQDVPTASVSLEQRPVLSVNLAFLNAHCRTEVHVKALLIHEFLHVLLRHTLEIRRMNPALNLALDSVINAMIHRKLGGDYSGFMSDYYAGAKGMQKLLRPPSSGECRVESEMDYGTFQLWYNTYAGRIQYQDVLESIKGRAVLNIEQSLADGRPLLLGNHDENAILDPGDLPGHLEGLLNEAARQLAADGSLPGNPHTKPGDLSVPPAKNPHIAAWQRQTMALLRGLVTPDRRSTTDSVLDSVFLPIPSTTDRRGIVQGLWNPILRDMAWAVTRPVPLGSVLVYLDVSGSMDEELQALVTLLNRLGPIIRRPFYAFGTTVEPATIRNGRLQTRTTGGTCLGPVIQHIRKTNPQKALIATDGFVEGLSKAYCATLGTRVEVLLTPEGTTDRLRASGWKIHRLTALRS